MNNLSIRVFGEPAPQGSKTAIVRNGKAIMYEASKKLPKWRDSVLMTCKVTALEQKAETPMLGPLAAAITFYLERPHSTSRAYPNNAPDVDKLLRAVFDGLQESGVISNDGQIVSVTAFKRWADNLNPPGAMILISKKELSF